MVIANNNFQNRQRYVDIEFLELYIGFKKSTIRDWVRFNKIPYLKIGKGIRFDLKRIDVWAQEKQVEK